MYSLDKAEENLSAQRAVILLRVAHVPVRCDERGQRVDTSGALLEVGCDSFAKSRTLVPAALSTWILSSGVGLVYSRCPGRSWSAQVS
jgi:hypothetical protein